MAQRRSNRYDAAKEARALNFATALADALYELHITHKDLAQQLGVSIFSVDYWTRGVNPSMPGAENLNRLCALLEGRSPGTGVAVARAAGYSWQPDVTASPVGSQPDQHGPETAPGRERATPTNLPHRISSFIGREREIGEVRELLSRVRLLTLTGAGGIGKTSLAIEVAAACVNLFPDGVWLVELAPLSDPSALPQAVAYALDVRDEPGQSTTDKLTVHVGKKRVLLVLDNCEHLVEESARITMRLLQTCPGLTVLATSREALRLDGETLWRVPPLGVPDISRQAAPTNLLGHAAIRLFVERATSSSSAFGMTEQNAASVTRICTQLDGIPLAIELAAACVSFLTLEQIEARLSDQFRLLTTGSRMVLPRHRTLHAAIEWSYKLLSVEEQALFRRLSVFAGGWSLEGAEAICTGARVDLLHVAPMLKALVDKSLVLAETKGYAARYLMLQTIREYAALRLEEEEDAGVLRTRHAAYYADLAERAEPELLGQHQTEWLNRLEAEHANIRAALRGCDESGDIQTGLRLAGALLHFWLMRGYLNESRERLHALLEGPHGALDNDHQRLIWGRAYNTLGGIAQSQGDYAVAEECFSQGLALRREIGDMRLIAGSLSNLGNVAWLQGDYARARELYTESLALRRSLGDKLGMAISLNNLGLIAWYGGDPVTSRALHSESLALYEETGNRWGASISLNDLGNLAWFEDGDGQKARLLYEKSLLIRRELNAKTGIPTALSDLARVACAEGRYKEARALWEESLRLCWEIGEKRCLISCLMGIAWVQTASDCPDSAVCLLGAATALTESTGFQLRPVDIAEYKRTADAARIILGDAQYAEAWQSGYDMTVEQAIRLALNQ